eukprot:COSAG06_NODE_112_length_23474_cov_81.804458_7_plen_107_part_00
MDKGRQLTVEVKVSRPLVGRGELLILHASALEYHPGEVDQVHSVNGGRAGAAENHRWALAPVPGQRQMFFYRVNLRADSSKGKFFWGRSFRKCSYLRSNCTEPYSG